MNITLIALSIARKWTLGLTLAVLGSSAVFAQSFPSKPIKIIVPNAAGGAADLTARTVAQKMAESLGQAVVIDNKPSAGPVITALRGGEIDAAIDILGPLMAQVSARAIRPVAILGEHRAAQLPQVPTVRESGGSLSAFNVSSWNGLAVPAKTPKDVVARLNREVNAALNLPDVKKRLLDLNLVAHSGSPEQAAELLAFEIKRWGDVISRAKIQKQ